MLKTSKPQEIWKFWLGLPLLTLGKGVEVFLVDSVERFNLLLPCPFAIIH
jgi:hypothetical protein